MLHFGRVERDSADAALRRLKFSNDDRVYALEVLAALRDSLPDPKDTRGVRRFLSAHPRAGTLAPGVLDDAELRERYDFVMQGVLRSGAPLSLAALASPRRSKEAGLPRAGEGATLRRLLELVLDDPTLNTREVSWPAPVPLNATLAGAIASCPSC